MKFITYCLALFTLFTAVACGKKEASMEDRVAKVESRAQWKCIENVLYERIGGDVWVEKGTKCRVEP